MYIRAEPREGVRLGSDQAFNPQIEPRRIEPRQIEPGQIEPQTNLDRSPRDRRVAVRANATASRDVTRRRRVEPSSFNNDPNLIGRTLNPIRKMCIDLKSRCVKPKRDRRVLRRATIATVPRAALAPPLSARTRTPVGRPVHPVSPHAPASSHSRTPASGLSRAVHHVARIVRSPVGRPRPGLPGYALSHVGSSM